MNALLDPLLLEPGESAAAERPQVMNSAGVLAPGLAGRRHRIADDSRPTAFVSTTAGLGR